MPRSSASRAAPVIVWLRRDFRLADHPALHCAEHSGRPVIPLFVRDESTWPHGAAPRWRLGLALDHFAGRLQDAGSRLILRSGNAAETLADLARETDASDVYWSCEYTPGADARDERVRQHLTKAGIGVRGFAGRLAFAPDAVRNKAGGGFKVFSPFWQAVQRLPVPPPLPVVTSLPPPDKWPRSDKPGDWRAGAALDRGAEVLAKYARAGEAEARRKTEAMLPRRLEEYRTRRDFLYEPSTSRLSENLAWGEISPRTVWHAVRKAAGADAFLRQLAWREFAYHVLFHAPDMETENWQRKWDRFPWRGDNPDAERWRRGRTGIPLVDAGMREMFTTGTMHNRARMVAASYLCKHLMTHWHVGLAWFAECLTDWDPASNAFGWQWAAGSGADAAPYFRVFNPHLQASRFDPQGVYCRRYVAELTRSGAPPQTALDYFQAIPRSWGMSPNDAYPSKPAAALGAGRSRALAAYHEWRRDMQNADTPPARR